MTTKTETSCNEAGRILLPLRDAADRLSIAVSTLRRWLRERRIAYVRCGRAVRIEVTEIQRFIDKNRREATQTERTSEPTGNVLKRQGEHIDESTH